MRPLSGDKLPMPVEHHGGSDPERPFVALPELAVRSRQSCQMIGDGIVGVADP